MKTNWPYLILAFLLAVTAWFMVSGRERVDAWVELPIELVGAPENIVVRSGLSSRLKARVRGPKGLVRTMDLKGVAYTLDLRDLKPGMNTLTLSPDKLMLPSGLEVKELDPLRMQVVADRFAVKTVLVEPRWVGDLAEHYYLTMNATEPDVTEIRGPLALVSEVQAAPTQTLELETSRPDVVEEIVPLDLPDEVVADPSEVVMRLVFAMKTQEIAFEAPLQLKNLSPLEAETDVATVWLKVRAPIPLIKANALRGGVTAQTIVGKALPPGEHALGYTLSLPRNVVLLEKRPELVPVSLTGAAPGQAERTTPPASPTPRSSSPGEAAPDVPESQPSPDQQDSGRGA